MKDIKEMSEQEIKQEMHMLSLQRELKESRQDTNSFFTSEYRKVASFAVVVTILILCVLGVICAFFYSLDFILETMFHCEKH